MVRPLIPIYSIIHIIAYLETERQIFSDIIYKYNPWNGHIAQWVNAPAAYPDSLSLVSESYMWEGENCLLQLFYNLYTYTHRYTHKEKERQTDRPKLLGTYQTHKQ